jgi:hypothetical protein
MDFRNIWLVRQVLPHRGATYGPPPPQINLGEMVRPCTHDPKWIELRAPAGLGRPKFAIYWVDIINSPAQTGPNPGLPVLLGVSLVVLDVFQRVAGFVAFHVRRSHTTFVP